MINRFKEIFRKKVTMDIDDRTIPLQNNYPGHESSSNNDLSEQPLQVLVGTGQSIGMLRDHNEDALFALFSTLGEANDVIPFGIFIVADGMGGHEHGELASGSAIRVMAEYLIDKLKYLMLGLESGDDSLTVEDILEQGVVEAQEAILAEVPGGGTTLTAAILVGNNISLAHVGDSRAYVFSAYEGIEVVTHDHSLVQRLVDLGQITEDEAEVHPQKNVLYRALGQSEPFTPDIKTILAPRPGYLLICSDGLWGQVPDNDMDHIIKSASNPSEACNTLVDAANEAGGPDNISAVLVQFFE